MSVPSENLTVDIWAWLPDVLAFVVIGFCIYLRIIPALLFGVPFLPDPWVHIGKADEILQIGYFNILGDYDDHWPGLNVLITVLSLFTGLDTISLGWLMVPVVCSLSLVFFYLMMRHLTENKATALVSLMLLGFAAPLTLIMGTTYKEGLARMLLIASLFAFAIRDPKQFLHVLPVVILVMAIIPVHHVTVLIAGSVLIFVMLSLQVFNLQTGVVTLHLWAWQTLAYLSVFGFALWYFVAFGIFQSLLIDARVLGIGLTVSFVVLGALNLRRVLSPDISKRTKIILLLVTVFLLGVFLLNFVTIPAFDYTVLPLSTLILLLPLMALGILAGLGFVALDKVPRRTRIFLSSFFLALLVPLVFALVSGRSTLNLVLTYRLSLFILAPLAALAGVGVFAYAQAHPQRTRLLQVLLLVGLLAVLPATTLAWRWNPSFGYGATVTPPIQASNQWVATYSGSLDVVAGDHLFTYYLLYYLDHPASIDVGMQLFIEGDISTEYELAGVHRYMMDNGFWLPSGVQWVPLYPGIIECLERQSYNALVYNNGEVQIYRRL